MRLAKQLCDDGQSSGEAQKTLDDVHGPCNAIQNSAPSWELAPAERCVCAVRLPVLASRPCCIRFCPAGPQVESPSGRIAAGDGDEGIVTVSTGGARPDDHKDPLLEHLSSLQQVRDCARYFSSTLLPSRALRNQERSCLHMQPGPLLQETLSDLTWKDLQAVASPGQGPLVS